METAMATLNYIELPVAGVAEAKRFFGEAFGWSFADYGPGYAAHEEAPCQLGLNGGGDGEATAAILPVIEVADLAATRAAVLAAGGTITRDIFAYPGGQRFHFREPGGLELAAYRPEH